MSAAIVQSKTGFVSGSAGLSITLDAPATVGNIIAIMGLIYDAVPPVGFGVTSWEAVKTVAGTGIWYGVVASAGSTLTTTSGGRSFAQGATVVEVSGATFAAAAAATKSTANGTGTTANAGTISPAAASIVLATWYGGAAYASGPTGGLTRMTPTGGGGIAIIEYGYKLGVAAPISSDLVIASSAVWSATILALADAAGSGSSRNPSSFGMLGVG